MKSKLRSQHMDSSLMKMTNDLDNGTPVSTNTQRGKRSINEHDNSSSKLVNLDDMENEVHVVTGRVKTRGKTYMPRVWMSKGTKEVKFNKFGQPIGTNKSEFVEFLGTLDKFRGAPGFDHWTKMNLGKKWKSWKNRVKSTYFDPTLSLEENLNRRPDSKDDRVLPDQWKNLVIYWHRDDIRDEEREAGKGNESDTYASTEGDDSKEYELTRVDLFQKYYTKKGSTPKPVVADAIQKMLELKNKLAADVQDIGPDDIFSRVNGADKWGRVRMYGFGVNASYVYGEKVSRGASYRMNEAYHLEIDKLMIRANEQDKLIKEQSRQIEEQNRQIQELLKINKQRRESLDSPPEVRRAPSSSSSNVNKMPLRVGTRIHVKSMIEPSKIVAIGRLESLNPLKQVGDMELGKNWCEVHVNVGVDMGEDLIRPIYDFTTIG